jgi:hypothetical protein
MAGPAAAGSSAVELARPLLALAGSGFAPTAPTGPGGRPQPWGRHRLFLSVFTEGAEGARVTAGLS